MFSYIPLFFPDAPATCLVRGLFDSPVSAILSMSFDSFWPGPVHFCCISCGSKTGQSCSLPRNSRVRSIRVFNDTPATIRITLLRDVSPGRRTWRNGRRTRHAALPSSHDPYEFYSSQGSVWMSRLEEIRPLFTLFLLLFHALGPRYSTFFSCNKLIITSAPEVSE